MNVTGRITTWLIPSILICGGCAGTAWRSPASSTDEVTPLAELGEADSREGQAEPPPMVTAEAALIRETALARGFSNAQARQFEQSIINALPQDRQFLTRFIYGELNRQNGSRPQKSVGVAESPALATPSPAAGYLVPRTAATSVAADGTPAIRTVSHTEPASAPTDQEAADSASSSSATTAEAATKNRPLPREQLTTAAKSKQDARAASTAPDIEADQDNGAPTNDSSRNAQRETQPAQRETQSAQRETQSAATASATTGAANQRIRLGANANNEPSHSAESSAEDAKKSWQRQLRLTISRLRRDLAENEELDPMDQARMRACLGLLHLAAEDDPERAMEALEGLDEQQLEFWRQTILGLDILLDSDELPKMRYRVESASERLRDGLSTLATLGPLRVNNLAFVSDVRSFGVYDEIKSRGFAPGEQVILYVEIGNFAVEEIAVDNHDSISSRRRASTATQVPIFESDLLSRYDILDQNQRVVMSRTLPVIRDRCRQHRRDFFIAYDFYIPKKIAAGRYTLELTVEDRKGDKFGSGTIDLNIR